MKNIEEDKKLPTTTAHQSRLQLFEPTRRPVGKPRTIQTAWGTAEVIGKIGQGHADVLECIFKNSLMHKIEADGTLQILIDPYTIRRAAASSDKFMSYSQLVKSLDELMQVVLTMRIENEDSNFIKCHIINRAIESSVDVDNKNSRFGGNKRKLWRIEISSDFVRFLNEDLRLDYNPELLTRLNSGISQAIARHVAGHRNQPQGGWKVDSLIEAVGAGGSSEEMRNRRRELQKDVDGLKALGICIASGRLTAKNEVKSIGQIPEILKIKDKKA